MQPLTLVIRGRSPPNRNYGFVVKGHSAYGTALPYIYRSVLFCKYLVDHLDYSLAYGTRYTCPVARYVLYCEEGCHILIAIETLILAQATSLDPPKLAQIFHTDSIANTRATKVPRTGYYVGLVYIDYIVLVQ